MAQGKRSTPEQFWRRTRSARNGCRLWLGQRDRDGYGRLWWHGRKARAHRVAFFLTHGRWPNPECRHTCDRPPCVLDEHLVEGTHAQNIAERNARGRTARGFRNGRAKLRAHQVAAIRRSAAGLRAAARKYGLHHTTVRDIRAGVLWKESPHV